MSPDSAPNPADLLREEIERLRVNRQRIQDPFMRDAVDQKIAHLEKRLEALNKPKKEEATEEDEGPVEPPTPKQLQEAEAFVRQARVEKMRNNALGSTELLRKAAEAAPTAPAVLESLADDLIERRQKKEAIALYKKAIKLDPKNVGLERKHAMLILGSSAGGMSIEDALRADWGAAPGAAPDEGMASPLAAIFLTLFIPGLGHIVRGKTSAGSVILGLWVFCVLWLALMAKSIDPLLHSLFGKQSGHANYVLLLPMAGIVVLYIVALGGMRIPRRTAGGARGRIKVDRPTPPVNLPFE